MLSSPTTPWTAQAGTGNSKNCRKVRKPRYLFHVLASHEFQEGLKNYRDLSYLHRNLDEWQQNVDVYANMLDTRKQASNNACREVQGYAGADRCRGHGAAQARTSTRPWTISNEATTGWHLRRKSESDMWREIAEIEDTPALGADIPEAAEVRDKICADQRRAAVGPGT